jgi:hypothetical protein
MCGGAAAEQRPVAAGPYSREVVRLDARRRVTHPVDAAKDGNEGARTQPALDLLSADSRSQQLPPGDYAM